MLLVVVFGVQWIGSVYNDDIVTYFIYTVPRNSVFPRTFKSKYGLMLRNYKSENPAAIKIKLNITNTAKPRSRTYVYHFLTP